MTQESQKELYGVCLDKVIEKHEPWQYSVSDKESKEVSKSLSSLSPSVRIAVIKEKIWSKRKLTVYFLEGDKAVQKKVKYYARIWSNFAKIRFVFTSNPNADIRISFDEGGGSWSYIGSDALSIDKDEPTMNYGWLDETSSDKEYSRVVLHEFGHALGCIHEHQNPAGEIPWNKKIIYSELGRPPNNWPKSVVDQNVFNRYSKTITQYSEFDPQSIMLYPIPARWTTNNRAIGGDNSQLSALDKEFMRTVYP